MSLMCTWNFKVRRVINTIYKLCICLYFGTVAMLIQVIVLQVDRMFAELKLEKVPEFHPITDMFL